MLPQPLTTERLRLIPMSGAMMEAAITDREQLASMSGARIPKEWPGDELAGALPLMLAAVRADPQTESWPPWLVVVDGAVAGDAGTHGKPDALGSVEIGFSVVPALRRQGIATAAVRALCSWLGQQPDVRVVTARTAHDNPGSIRVLESAGFQPAGREGGTLRYEMTV